MPSISPGDISRFCLQFRFIRRAQDGLEELVRCIAGGAVKMKCLPNCQNINCGAPRCRRFWERMAEAGLPLRAHPGGEQTVPVIREEFSDPRMLKLPIECGVKVIAAHCGAKSPVGPRFGGRKWLRSDGSACFLDTLKLNLSRRRSLGRRE